MQSCISFPNLLYSVAFLKQLRYRDVKIYNKQNSEICSLKISGKSCNLNKNKISTVHENLKSRGSQLGQFQSFNAEILNQKSSDLRQLKTSHCTF